MRRHLGVLDLYQRRDPMVRSVLIANDNGLAHFQIALTLGGRTQGEGHVDVRTVVIWVPLDPFHLTGMSAE